MTFEETSKVTSSHTSAEFLLIFRLTIGISIFFESWVSNTIGQFPKTSSLTVFHSSLSYIVTPNMYSQGSFNSKYV
jgi:hypothetical protein